MQPLQKDIYFQDKFGNAWEKTTFGNCRGKLCSLPVSRCPLGDWAAPEKISPAQCIENQWKSVGMQFVWLAENKDFGQVIKQTKIFTIFFKQTFSPIIFRAHLELSHQGRGPVGCTICGHRAKDGKFLQKHMSFKHPVNWTTTKIKLLPFNNFLPCFPQNHRKVGGVGD